MRYVACEARSLLNVGCGVRNAEWTEQAVHSAFRALGGSELAGRLIHLECSNVWSDSRSIGGEDPAWRIN